jgi:hypothetical protein
MNQAIVLTRGNTDCVCFRSLVDLFNPKASGIMESPKVDGLDVLTLNHYIATALTKEAKLCRWLLVTGCQPSRAGLRVRIDS